MGVDAKLVCVTCNVSQHVCRANVFSEGFKLSSVKAVSDNVRAALLAGGFNGLSFDIVEEMLIFLEDHQGHDVRLMNDFGTRIDVV